MRPEASGRDDGLLRLILILGAIAALGPLSIDMYLPSLPAIGRDLGADSGTAQLTLSAYFIGLAVGQMIYGPISDRFGRKAPLLFGLGLFSIASLGCALAPSIEVLIALRLLQALGGCAGIVVTRAMLRDRYQGNEMARVMSMLILVMGVAPILAPTLGGVIYLNFGWPAIFFLLTVAGVLCVVATTLGVSDEQRERAPPLRLRSVAGDYLHIVCHRRFMGYALAGGCGQAGMFAYITASPFVFIDYFRLSPDHYGYLFGVNALVMIAGSQINARLLRRFAAGQILRTALSLNLLAAIAMVAMAALHAGGFAGVAAPLVMCIGSLGFVFPNSQAGAMAPFGGRAGTASAMLGTLQFVLAGASSVLVSRLHTGDALGMAMSLLTCSLLAWSVLRTLVGDVAAIA